MLLPSISMLGVKWPVSVILVGQPRWLMLLCMQSSTTPARLFFVCSRAHKIIYQPMAITRERDSAHCFIFRVANDRCLCPATCQLNYCDTLMLFCSYFLCEHDSFCCNKPFFALMHKSMYTDFPCT